MFAITVQRSLITASLAQTPRPALLARLAGQAIPAHNVTLPPQEWFVRAVL
jgi:hypothetical protein